MCGAKINVTFGPIADSFTAAKTFLFAHLVGAAKHRRGQLGRRLEIENTFGEVDNGVDEWRLDVQTGLADHTHRLAKADQQRLLRLINGEQRRESDQPGYAKNCEDGAEKILGTVERDLEVAKSRHHRKQ